MFRSIALLLALWLPLVGSAHADSPAPPAAATANNTPATPPAGAAALAPAAGGDLNFDLIDEQKPKEADPAEKARLAAMDKKVRLRRQLLTWHQGIGFATLGLLAATCVLGQLAYNDKYGGGDDTGVYVPYHQSFAGLASLGFATTGILALAAPNPYPKKLKFDTAMVHKISMIAATAGMVAQIILGIVTTVREGNVDQRDLALGHLAAGYATFGFMTAGTLAYVF